MDFIKELIVWFIRGSETVDAPVADLPPVETTTDLETNPAKKKKSVLFDIHKDAPAEVFLRDLQSLKPITKQFDNAREELLKELQRLAPPKRSRKNQDRAA